ncbi:MAG: LPXTG cell wall anchor domain-containing protein, partial [Candidatus Limosilactobacillus intestinavium]
AEVTFTRKGTTDLVTGKTDWQPWDQGSQTFVAVPSPSITGYTADQSQIDAQNVTVGDQDIVKTVTYTADPEIPNPSIPNVPNDEDSLKGKGFENDSSLKGKSNNEVANNKQQLPQTGNESNRELGVVGLGLTSIISLIGLSGFKKKHD